MKKLELRVDVALSPSLVAKALDVPISQVPAISGISLDSRSVEKGDLFVALVAARNGHDYVDEAIKKGASVALVHESRNYAGQTLMCVDSYQGFCRLANAYRVSWGRKIIGVSGSNGKTTTKQILSALLSAYAPTLMSPGTWNNHLGVPLTLFLLRDMHQFAVLEMGMNHAEELTQLSIVAEPNVGILTGIGKAHIEHFGTLEAIADAKWELMQGLSADGVGIINIDDAHIRRRAQDFKKRMVTVSTLGKADVYCSNIEDEPKGGYRFDLHYGDDTLRIKSQLLGKHNLSNLMCALGAAYTLGVPGSKLQNGIDSIIEPEMRLQRIKLNNGVLLIEDCYNANPSSTEAALDVLSQLKAARKIVVLGDMLELGIHSASSHREMGYKAAKLGVHEVLAVGQYSNDVIQGALEGGLKSDHVWVFKSKDDLSEKLQKILTKGDMVLIKGSRANKLETVSSKLSAYFGKES